MADVDDRKALIQRLFGAANKHADEGRLDGYLESLRLMDTPRLLRVVDKILSGIGELTDPEDYKPPTAGAIWKVARALRRLPEPPPLELHGAPEQKHDGWDINANTFLLNYVTLGLVQRVVHNQKASRNAARYAPPACTAVMVKWKNAWARDMREDRDLYDGKLEGKAHWLVCMVSAEAEIDALGASQQVAA